MSKLVLAAAVAVSTSLLTACPLAPSCGGFQGEGDQVFASAAGDSFVACENGGFAVTFANGRAFSGLRHGDNVLDPATGAIAFDFEIAGTDDGTQVAHSVALGGGTFDALEMTEVKLDHADALCRDLAQQPWFTSQAERLPIATAFTSRDAAGGDPDVATMLLCPDGTARIALAGAVHEGTYTAEGGELGIFVDAWNLSGTYENASGEIAGGTLATFQLEAGGTAHWQTVAPADVDLSCAR